MSAANYKNVLTFSDAVRATSAQACRGGWYNGHCPAHNDSTPSLGIKERPNGTFAVKCQAGCSRQQVIEALEQKTGKRVGVTNHPSGQRGRAERGITLDQYAEMKKLPRKYLAYFGTIDYPYNGKSAILHTYLDEDMKPAGNKYRLSTDSHDIFGRTTRSLSHTVSCTFRLGLKTV